MWSSKEEGGEFPNVAYVKDTLMRIFTVKVYILRGKVQNSVNIRLSLSRIGYKYKSFTACDAV